MTIAKGDRLPDATFRVFKDEGVESLTTKDVFDGKKVVLFAVPGAFTPTCHLKHLPGFILCTVSRKFTTPIHTRRQAFDRFK